MTALDWTEQDERTARAWRRMTPEQRDYDRLVAGRVPPAVIKAGSRAVWTPETDAGREMADRYADLDDEALDAMGCTCMRSAPCSWCMTHCPDCSARTDDFETHLCQVIA